MNDTTVRRLQLESNHFHWPGNQPANPELVSQTDVNLAVLAETKLSTCIGPRQQSQSLRPSGARLVD
jgi:hypothetical protein